ncbi:MAG: thermonuclease family protein [Elusimicrobia bacterium]|nr:thermonuclease family protein [Elusimicrobiota bacterium]MBK7545649.1 thermonuclease family protein [Elusimicrobiota bacterium]MBK7574912.1 thermonuclease family protein [Elusimicrobiota bacterium]MBK7687435.1 thermonuclease family protein [Elusimicrobiota bacterium]MBK8125650.1 thermonuclease family protein [Elusimicrobiota bacterium]
MSKDMVLSVPQFEKLAKDLQRLVDEGRDKAKAANNAIFLKTCWAMGGRIEVEDLAENAGYATTVMERLAKPLKTDRTTLVRCVQFYRAYPKGAPDTPLTWSHYRYLLTLGTDKERVYYEEKAIKEGWTREQLAKAINAEDYLAPKDGSKKAKKLPRPTSPFFTFRAEVLRVVDGDTIVFRVDLGFQVWKEQIIRLAGVDAPALKEGGEEAFEYVRAQMGKAKTVVIQTNKIDIYGRYVAHVYYSFDENDSWEKVFASGRYLSQDLLDRSLARAV